MKKALTILIPIIVIIVSLSNIFVILIDKADDKYDKVLEHLIKFEKSDNVFYSDEFYIYSKKETIEINKIDDYDVYPLYVMKKTYILLTNHQMNIEKFIKLIILSI